jgi:hypothetical protein
MGFFHQLNNSELLKEGPVAWDQNYFQGAIMVLGLKISKTVVH